MKRFIKPALVITILFACLFANLLFAAPLDEKAPPTPTGKILDTNMFAINGDFVSVYLYYTGNGYILFDTGSDPKMLEAGLTEIGITPEDIDTIFLSHSDGDHVAGLTLFPKAKIYINEAEMPMLTGEVSRGGDRYNKLPEGVENDRLTTLKDGQELEITIDTQENYLGGAITKETSTSIPIRVINAPGHTPGSTMYVINNEFIFTGDALKIADGNCEVHPFTMDEKQAQATIDASLDTLKKYFMLTSHFGILKN